MMYKLAEKIALYKAGNKSVLSEILIQMEPLVIRYANEENMLNSKNDYDFIDLYYSVKQLLQRNSRKGDLKAQIFLVYISDYVTRKLGSY